MTPRRKVEPKLEEILDALTRYVPLGLTELIERHSAVAVIEENLRRRILASLDTFPGYFERLDADVFTAEKRVENLRVMRALCSLITLEEQKLVMHIDEALLKLGSDALREEGAR